MKIAVVGSRCAKEKIVSRILRELPPGVSEIVSGGAEGVDTAAEKAADILGIPATVFRPNYDAYGRRAPLVRNGDIIRYADEVLAFWDGQPPGTQQTIAECIRLGKPVRIIPLHP